MILRPYQTAAVESLFDYYATMRKLDANGQPERKNPLLCLPTGTGKSLVIADFLKQAFTQVPSTRVIMATHVKELISQNAAELQEAWPLAPLGIYSAGLRSRDMVQPIIFGGIQSMQGKDFGHRDFLVIDEAHLVGSEGRYLKFINELQQVNPFLKVIGLSATPYRLGLGYLTNGNIFTDITYNLCNIDGFARLIAEGYLSTLIPKRGSIEIDVTGISCASDGDFKKDELEAAIKKQNIATKALAEAVAYGQDRRSWLVFASGVSNAEEISLILEQRFKIDNVCIHSERKQKDNDNAIKAWKAGEVRCAVNMGMLTTGVNNPALDFIVMLRPTMSTGLWVQMLGRGTRPYADKVNCLVLDYSGNTRRLGPINDPVIPKLKGEKQDREAPVKVCEVCSSYNHASVRFCVVCGAEFPIEQKIVSKASGDELLADDMPITEMIKVDRVIYVKYTARSSGRTMIKACYYCGINTYYEYITVEGQQGRIRGRNWFRQRFPSEPPATDDEVLQLASQLRAPNKIRIWTNKKTDGKIYPEIIAAEF